MVRREWSTDGRKEGRMDNKLGEKIDGQTDERMERRNYSFLYKQPLYKQLGIEP